MPVCDVCAQEADAVKNGESGLTHRGFREHGTGHDACEWNGCACQHKEVGSVVIAE